jgi:Spermine/spermidine synthase domain
VKTRRDLFIATFGILALELAVIRWISQQVRVFAYLNNVLLMAAFLGMGLGVAMGRRRPALVRGTLPMLGVLMLLLAFSDRLGIARLGFPDQSIAMWGIGMAENAALSAFVILAIFAAVVAVFFFAGSIVGWLFANSDALDAYASDLLGSLAGVVAVTVAAAFGTPPTVWFALGVAAFLWLAPNVGRASARPDGLKPVLHQLLAAAVVLAAAHFSIAGALFSPYYRIDLDTARSITGAPIRLSVNRDFHQYMHDLSFARLARERGEQKRRLQFVEYAYRLPFLLTERKESALIVGAGTGNDVAAALRARFRRVVSVDIDPAIIRIGRQMHPERPYSDPRVVAVVNDARAYFEQTPDARFDVVCFGLLDSHAMFSSMASLRLDNYVYTVESIRSAWRQVADGGVLSLSFSIGDREWLADRLAAIVTAATGQRPVVVFHGVQGGRSFLVGKNVDVRAAAARARIRAFAPREPQYDVRVSTDDWPFLYVRPATFPYGYVAVLGGVLLIALISTRAVYGRETFSRSFDPALFFMGAAFLLIETRGVTDLSLLFGSTWIVNASVFAGILLTAWSANAIVRRRGAWPLRWLFIALAAALVVNYFVRPSMLLPLGLLERGIAGGLLNGLPVGIAGLLFSQLLARSEHPDAALGSNLLGTVLGGCLEYLSVLTGLRALTLVALALYAAAFLALRVSSARAPSLPA